MIIVIIIVIALLGVLGFVFWNSISQKAVNDATTDTPTSSTAGDEPQRIAPSPETDKDYLDLQEWGVKFKLPSQSYGITYYQLLTNGSGLARGFDDHYYEFSTKEVENLGGECVDSGDGTVIRLASLSRSKNKIETQGAILVNDGQPIEGYYYYLQGAQSTCSSDNINLQSQSRDSLVELLKSPISY